MSAIVAAVSRSPGHTMAKPNQDQIRLLVGLGVDELSVHPPMVARIKAIVRQLNAAECATVAAAALSLEGGTAVRQLLEQRHLEPSSFRPPTGR